MDARIALTGFGNVGRGLATLLQDHADEYRDRYGVRIVLTGVADRAGAVVASSGLSARELLEAKREHGSVVAAGGTEGLAGADFLEAAGANVLVEAASTNFEDAQPGWGYVLEALQRRMDVVLASKGALVLHFDELMATAHERSARVLYAATIGAPAPILELADRVLVGVDISEVEGIVNATTNQILASMAEGLTYDEGVRVAQEIGVAEEDPTLDVDGWDAAAKAVILARSLFAAPITLGDVARTGIRGVTQVDLATAAERGMRVKFVARISGDQGAVQASVGPEERHKSDPLGRLEGQEMGVILRSAQLGDVTSTVALTGGIPTALTVLRDIVNLARDRGWTSQR